METQLSPLFLNNTTTDSVYNVADLDLMGQAPLTSCQRVSKTEADLFNFNNINISFSELLRSAMADFTYDFCAADGTGERKYPHNSPTGKEGRSKSAAPVQHPQGGEGAGQTTKIAVDNKEAELAVQDTTHPTGNNSNKAKATVHGTLRTTTSVPEKHGRSQKLTSKAQHGHNDKTESRLHTPSPPTTKKRSRAGNKRPGSLPKRPRSRPVSLRVESLRVKQEFYRWDQDKGLWKSKWSAKSVSLDSVVEVNVLRDDSKNGIRLTPTVNGSFQKSYAKRLLFVPQREMKRVIEDSGAGGFTGYHIYGSTTATTVVGQEQI